MEIKFFNEWYFDQLIKMKLIAEYDISTEAREKHSEEIRKMHNRPTMMELIAIVKKEYEDSRTYRERPLGPNEEVANPWINPDRKK